MSLARDLDTGGRVKRTRPCEFGAWVGTLDPDDAAAVRTALRRTRDDPRYWTSKALWRRLFDAGYTGSEATVYKHRGDECQSCR